MVQYHKEKGLFWVRIFRRGFLIKDFKIHPLLFSQRNGRQKSIKIGKYYIQSLMKLTIITIVSLLSLSCTVEEMEQSRSGAPKEIAQKRIPEYLLGEYTIHSGDKKEVVLAISETDITLQDEFSDTYTTIFVNGDCWVIIYLDNGLELRISDYIKEKNFVVLSLWDNGHRIKEYGVFDKIK